MIELKQMVGGEIVEHVHLELKAELKETLKKEAEAKGLKLNQYIRMLLIERGK